MFACDQWEIEEAEKGEIKDAALFLSKFTSAESRPTYISVSLRVCRLST